MKRILNTLLLLICGFIGITTSDAHAAVNSAEAQSVQVEIDTPQDPTQIIGFIFANGQISQRTKIEWRRAHPGAIVATIPLESSDRSGMFVSAMATAADGSNVFSNVKQIGRSGYAQSFYSIQQCPPVVAPKGIETQAGLIEALFNVRVERRGYMQLKIKSLLQGELLEKLNRLEKGLGLARGEALSASLPPIELADRLSRLEKAVASYRARKGAKKAS